jgi:hypothetical protein
MKTIEEYIKENNHVMVLVYSNDNDINMLSRLLFISGIEYDNVNDANLKIRSKIRHVIYYITDNASFRKLLYIHNKKEMIKVIECLKTIKIYNKKKFNVIRRAIWKYLDRG